MITMVTVSDGESDAYYVHATEDEIYLAMSGLVLTNQIDAEL